MASAEHRQHEAGLIAAAAESDEEQGRSENLVQDNFQNDNDPNDSSSIASVEVCKYCVTETDEHLIQPCACAGTTAAVHPSCLQRWIDTRPHENPFQCEVCQQQYTVTWDRHIECSARHALSGVAIGHACEGCMLLVSLSSLVIVFTTLRSDLERLSTSEVVVMGVMFCITIVAAVLAVRKGALTSRRLPPSHSSSLAQNTVRGWATEFLTESCLLASAFYHDSVFALAACCFSTDHSVDLCCAHCGCQRRWCNRSRPNAILWVHTLIVGTNDSAHKTTRCTTQM